MTGAPAVQQQMSEQDTISQALMNLFQQQQQNYASNGGVGANAAPWLNITLSNGKHVNLTLLT